MDPGSAYYDDAGGCFAPSRVTVAVAGLTKRFVDHIQKDFLINVWGYVFYIDLFGPAVEKYFGRKVLLTD